MLSLIRDARFPRAVNDVDVQFGNARYQNVMDRFMAGENIPDDSLRQVWQTHNAAKHSMG